MIEIKKIAAWSDMDVRDMCIKEGFYTRGDCRDYKNILDYVNNHNQPDDLDVYIVAENILNHTSTELGQTVENIMYILANDVIKYFYEVEEEQ